MPQLSVFLIFETNWKPKQGLECILATLFFSDASQYQTITY